MQKYEQEPQPAVSREQASAAGLIVVFLFFGLLAGSAILLNACWPAVQLVARTAPNGGEPQ